MLAIKGGFRPAFFTLTASCQRQLSSLDGPTLRALDDWIASPKRTVLHDNLHPERLADLYITLPTRDGTSQPFRPPKLSKPLGYGHHMAFFHPLVSESNFGLM
ncbi:hypothetical protein MPER_05245, partial [Moniliophthora perniciosa FA553]